MIKKLLSRYGLRYPRTLIYMLQGSEYRLREYFGWYRRVENFNRVERRKHLVKTPKAVLLLIFSWIIILFLYFTGIFLFLGGRFAGKIFALVFLAGAPYILAYAIAALLLLADIFIQKPVEFFLIRKAKRKLAGHPAVKIGIAGSFGKTSMREILKTVLLEGKRVAAPPENYNTPLGISRFAAGLTGQEEVLIFELGEYYPGDILKLCDLVRPQVGIITGINEAHLEKFGSLDRTGKTIFELADYLGEKTVYVNSENDLAKKSARSSHRLYGRNGAGGCGVENAGTDLDGTRFILIHEAAKLNVESRLLGLHQIGPLAVAADIAFGLDFSPERIRQGIAKTKPFSHRLEPKIWPGGVIMLDDSYNGNPDGAAAVIDFLGSLKNRRRFYVTPGLVEMGARTEAVHKIIGQKLSTAGIEKVVLIKTSAAPFIEAGLKEADYRGEILWFDDIPAALGALPLMTVEGDIVLLQNDWPDQYQ